MRSSKAETKEEKPSIRVYAFRAVFDVDGVVTRTADLHAAAWKEMFDACLAERRLRGERPSQPFDITADYRAYVDGKPRYGGARSFLAARDIRQLTVNAPEGGCS